MKNWFSPKFLWSLYWLGQKWWKDPSSAGAMKEQLKIREMDQLFWLVLVRWHDFRLKREELLKTNNSSSYQTEWWRGSADRSTVLLVLCSGRSDAAWCSHNKLSHYQGNPADSCTWGTEGQVTSRILLQRCGKLNTTVHESKTSHWLDSSWSHRRTVGVPVTRIRSTGVLHAADAVQQVFKARKTFTVRLNQNQQKHTGLILSDAYPDPVLYPHLFPDPNTCAVSNPDLDPFRNSDPVSDLAALPDLNSDLVTVPKIGSALHASCSWYWSSLSLVPGIPLPSQVHHRHTGWTWQSSLPVQSDMDRWPCRLSRPHCNPHYRHTGAGLDRCGHRRRGHDRPSEDTGL